MLKHNRNHNDIYSYIAKSYSKCAMSYLKNVFVKKCFLLKTNSLN